MIAAAGCPSHWVMRMARAMSASRAVRRFVSRDGMQTRLRPRSGAMASVEVGTDRAQLLERGQRVLGKVAGIPETPVIPGVGPP